MTLFYLFPGIGAWRESGNDLPVDEFRNEEKFHDDFYRVVVLDGAIDRVWVGAKDDIFKAVVPVPKDLHNLMSGAPPVFRFFNVGQHVVFSFDSIYRDEFMDFLVRHLYMDVRLSLGCGRGECVLDCDQKLVRSVYRGVLGWTVDDRF